MPPVIRKSGLKAGLGRLPAVRGTVALTSEDGVGMPVARPAAPKSTSGFLSFYRPLPLSLGPASAIERRGFPTPVMPAIVESGVDYLRTTNHRPIISSAGAIYGIFPDANRRRLAVRKSLDPTTFFSEVGGSPLLATRIGAFDYFQVADVLHVATFEETSATTARLSYHTFSMATDTWTISSELIETVTADIGLPSSDVPFAMACSISVRSDGDVIVAYSGSQDTIMGANWQRVDYARREAGVWTVGVAVDNAGSIDWLRPIVVLGSSDRMHIFFVNGSVNGGFQRCLRSDNTLETFPAVYGTILGVSRSGTSYLSGGVTKVRCPYGRGASSSASPAAAGGISLLDSADTPTAAEEVVGDVDDTYARREGAFGGFIQFRNAPTIAVDGTTLYYLYIQFANRDIYLDKNADGAGWGTDLAILTGETVTWVSASVYTRKNQRVLAYFYDGAGTVKYNEYLLVQFERTLARRLELGLGRGLA